MRRRAMPFATLAAALALVVLAGSARAASAACERMSAWLHQGGGSASGLLVVDAESGQAVCATAAGTPRSLASNMKLFTTSTALSELGPNLRIPTKVFRDGRIDANGVLHGSLYLQGG